MKLDKFWTSFVWFWFGLTAIGLIKAHLRAVTVIDDLNRNQVNFTIWEPYVWEYSSTLVMLLLVFLVAFWVKKYSIFSQQWKTNLLWHIMGSLLFSLLHVLLMVFIRQVIYYLLGSYYDFGDWATEWWYEYRKDVVTYFTLLLFIELYFYLKPGLKVTPAVTTSKLKIKNQNGVFLLDPEEIFTVESGGNYVYLHVNDAVLLHRATMAEMEKLLDATQFLRIHRSYIVNLKKIKGLIDQSKDPCTLILVNGKEVPVSRKYRKNVINLMTM